MKAMNFYEGNYTEYMDWLKQTLGAQAAEPHRIKYKRISLATANDSRPLFIAAF